MTASTDSSVPTKVDHTFFSFSFNFFSFVIDVCNNGSLLLMLLRQFCLGNNLLMHLRVNTDFPQQKPRQLPSGEVNFKGWSNEKL